MKEKSIKIGVSIIAIIAIVVIYIFTMSSPNITKGEIRIIVIDDNAEVIIDDTWEFDASKGNVSLRTILEEHYDIVVRNKMLMGINGLETDNINYFWKIYLNCQMATKGIENLAFKDGDEIRLVYTAVGDYYNNAC